MTRTFMRWLSLLSLLLLFAGVGSATAAEGQIYTIKKGDTLWDLSQKFIDVPYYWPNIWSKNPEITNPHLIFPGQKIRVLDGRLEIVPAYAEKQTPQETQEAPAAQAPQENLVTVKAAVGGNSFILADEQALGLVVDSVDNRVLLTANDTVFVKMTDPSSATVGNTYGLFERGDEVKHPVTGAVLGTMMLNLGSLQVTEVAGGTVVAKIGDVYREVTRGAELYKYIPPRKDVTLQRGATEQKGLIIATPDEKGTVSTNDVIFIDLGKKDGLKEGNLLYISRPRVASDEMIKKAGSITLPDDVLGAAVVVDNGSATASAIIIKSVNAAFIGDHVSVVTE